MKYFGEDPDDTQCVSSFFSKFALFVSEYKKAKQDNLLREEENRAYEARKRLAEAPRKADQLKANGQGGAAIALNGKPQKVMDSLLEKLRAAGPSGNARTARRRAAARKHMVQRRMHSISMPHNEEEAAAAAAAEAEAEAMADNEHGNLDAAIDKHKGEDGDEHEDEKYDYEHGAEHDYKLTDAESDGEEKGHDESDDGNDMSKENGLLEVDSESSPVTLAGDTGLSEGPKGPNDSVSDRLTSEHEDSSPSTNNTSNIHSLTDDVGGRARQLLQELRAGNSEYSATRSASPTSGRLAEMRARQAQRRRTGQQSSAHSSAGASAKHSTDSAGAQRVGREPISESISEGEHDGKEHETSIDEEIEDHGDEK